MDTILALDQGTTSSRAILFDRTGAMLAVAQREFTQHFPRPGWVEHDPEEIWSSQAGVATEVLTRLRRGDRVAAIGIANQRETTLVWERDTGRPVCNAIVWQDRRTAGICDALIAEGHADTIRRKTGLVIDAYFSGTKLKWILDNVPGARDRAVSGELAFGTVDSWLLWKLTEGRIHATDISNASRTMLFDLRAGRWDDELCALLGVPRAMLPEVRPCSEAYGETRLFGQTEPIPIGGMAGDQQAALFGQMCVERGMSKNTYGTGAFLLMNIGDEAIESRNKLLTTVAWGRPGGPTTYALEGSVFIAGAVVQWLRDGLKIIRTAEDVNALAATVADTGGVYLVPAFAGLGAPHWDPYARGALLGITRGTTDAHVARAALESIAWQSADLIDAMRGDAGIELKELRVDGGAAASDLLLQFQADVLGVPVLRPQVTETTALGAAYHAGLAVGFWKSCGELANQWRVERVFEPTMPRERAEERKVNWRRAVERAKGWEVA